MWHNMYSRLAWRFLSIDVNHLFGVYPMIVLHYNPLIHYYLLAKQLQGGLRTQGNMVYLQDI